jgi:hypothetical protein
MSDWGKGVTNNQIGWGQGSSNDIGWGSAYADSWSGDTDLEKQQQQFLLDQYGGAAAAYSVRKLSSTATLSMRVRRSLDNAEQDIGFVGEDLDTASLLTFVGAGNGFVTIWYDQSGNGKDAHQSTASDQRQIVVSGSLQVDNGKVATISTATSTQYNTLSPVYDVTTSYIASFTVSNPTGNVFGAYFGTSPSSQGFRVYKTNSTDIRVDTIRAITLIKTYTSGIGQEILFTSANRTVTKAIKNGLILGADGTDSNADFLSSSNFSIWGEGISGRCLKGKAQEIIMYNTDQSANRTAIELNINTYYSIY